MINFDTTAAMLSHVIDAMKQVEKVFPGEKRGAEKLRGALNYISANLHEIKETYKESTSSVVWFSKVLDSEVFEEKLAQLIGNLVDVTNFMKLADDIPDDPKVVN